MQGLELRLDRFPSIDLPALEKLVRASPLPLLFTLRKQSHGGSFLGSEERRLQLIAELLKLEPTFLDLEHDTPLPVLGKTKLILSYHNFEETPDLERVFGVMQKTPAYAYKIACRANSSLDALRMSLFIQEQKSRLIGVCMGKEGAVSRILAPIVGSWMSFATSGENREHQLTLDTYNTYRFRELNPQTKIYALLGNPLDKSPSHRTHNAIFEMLKQNAVYLKIPLLSEELIPFFSTMRALPFHGFSVTMPHKQAVLPLLDTLTPRAKAAGAVNTIRVSNGKLHGDNTDGIAAVELLKEQGKKILLLGAGGAARAIAYELACRGAAVAVYNRTKARAQELARAFDLLAVETIPEEYDILINTTPVCPLQPDQILPGRLVMDIVFGETELVKTAQARGCMTISGKELFIHQAAHQFAFWCEGIDLLQVRKTLSTLLEKW